MAFPSYVLTRTVSVGGAAILESSDPLRIRLTITASKSLINAETGYRFKNSRFVTTSEAGTDAVAVLPRTDMSGWKDARTGDIIDVTAEGSYTHQYIALVEYLTAEGDSAGISPDTIGPFIVPAGDGVIDLDKLVPVGSSSGESISFPAYWDDLVQQAQASAAAAQAALLDSADFIGSEIARSGSPAEQALLPKIAQVGAATFVTPAQVAEMIAAALAPAVPLGSRWVFDGDSITIGSTSTAGGVRQDHGKSWVTPFAGMAMGSIDYLFNAGVGGQDSTDALGRFDAFVAPHDPDVVFLNIGANDVGQGDSMATFIANLNAYRVKCVNIGATMVVGAVWPSDGTSVPAQQTRVAEFNAALYDWAATNRILVVPWNALINVSTGGWPVGWSSDGVHPGLVDSYDLIAKFGVEAIAERLGEPVIPRITVNGQGEFANGLFELTTAGPSAPTIGSATPSTGSGTLPAGLYSYKITSRSYWGETLPSAAIDATLSSTGQIALATITAPSNNRGRRLYRKGPGDAVYKYLTTITGITNNYTDTGAVAPSSSIVAPTVNTAATVNGLISNGTTPHDIDNYGPHLRTVPGILGNVVRITKYDGTSGFFLDRLDIPVTAGDVIEFSCLVQGSGGDDTSIELQFRSATPATIASLVATRGWMTQGFRLAHIRFTVPANAVTMRVNLTGGASSTWLDIAEVLVAKV